MHIQSYQISNILNAYRKQLSQRTTQPDQPTSTSRYKSILDKVSINLTTRITERETEKPFALTVDHTRSVTPNISQSATREKLCFAYTLIDENNNKSTNSLAVDDFYSFAHKNITYATLASKSTL